MEDMRTDEVETDRIRNTVDSMNRKKDKGLLRRSAACAVTCAMLAGLLPGHAWMVKAYWEPVDKYESGVTSVGVSGIENPSPSYCTDQPWIGSIVYYGGHRFRVLTKDTTDFSADGGILPRKHTMLLDSDSVLSEHIHFDNDGSPNSGAERASEWEYSDLKAWLNDSENGFLRHFSKAEIAGIANSTKPDPAEGDGKGFPNMRYAPLKDDRVFVLDAVEASNENYGYDYTSGVATDSTDALRRVKTSNDSYDTVHNCDQVQNSGIWWLRSPFYSPRYPNYAGFVYGVSATEGFGRFAGGGYFTTNIVSYGGPGASPALNVDLDSVLLSTCVKREFNHQYGYERDDYKLTLIYDGLETAITQGANISITDKTVNVPFTVTDKDPDDGINADRISVLVVQNDRTSGTIKKYEKLSDLSFENGTASGEKTFDLPDDYDSSTDHIYVFAEDANADNVLTDYASAPLALLQPKEEGDLVYNGDLQNLLTDEMVTIPSGYTAEYALSEDEPETESYSSEIPSARDAGTYRVWYRMSRNDDSILIGPNSMTVTIAKKQVEVSGVTAEDKEYDGTRNASLSKDTATLNPEHIVPGDDISIYSLEGRFKYADAGENKPVTVTKITLDGASQYNYAAVADDSGLTATVTPRPVKVTGITAEDKKYDGTTTVTISKAAANIEGEAFIDSLSTNALTISSKTTAQFENAAAGTNKAVILDIRLAGYCAGNYVLSEDSQKTAPADIIALPVKITGLAASNKEYDGTTTATVTGTPKIEGTLPGDEVTAAAGRADFADANVGDNKDVSFSGWSLAGAASGNYTLSAQPEAVKANITKKSITGATITLSDTQLEYNESEQSVSVTGVTVDGRTLAASDYDVSGEMSGTEKGSYTVKVTGKGNYKDEATAVWKITGKLMTVTAPDVTATYDGADHGIVVSVNRPDSGAIVKYGETEGTYDLDVCPTITNVSDSPKTIYFKVTAEDFEDYTGSATVTVLPESVAVSGIMAENKTYDGRTDAVLDCSGVKFNGKTVSGLTVTATGRFADADAGKDKTVHISNIALDGTGKDNYVLAESGQQSTAMADILTADIPAEHMIDPKGIENLTYTGSALKLVTAGSCDYGTMQYALGRNLTTAPTDGWSDSIPAGTEIGTYYVWYMVKGDANHNDTRPAVITVEIRKKDDPAPTPTITPSPTDDPVGVIRMLRLYNPNTGEHFYTRNEKEKDSLVAAGWTFEGGGFYTLTKSDKPIYRLYNPNAGEHHYTGSIKERDYLVTAGWKYEGIAWYASNAKDGVKMYRMYNPNAETGTHHFTTSEKEKENLENLGWKYEGIAFYACKRPG